MTRPRHCASSPLAIASAMLAAGLARPAQGLDVDIHRAFHPTGDNLVKNPGFEDGANGRPADWRFGTAMPENFVAEWSTDAHTERHSVRILSHSGRMSGYWAQTLPVKANENYRLTAWAKMTGGRILMYALGYDATGKSRRDLLDARRYLSCSADHPLVPVFLKPEYMPGVPPNEWRQMVLDFKPPEGIARITVHLGSYFQAGEMWFDDVALHAGSLDMTLSVKCEAGEPAITRVSVLPMTGGDPVFDSGPLPGVRTYSEPLTKLRPSAPVRVVVRTRDGRTHERAFTQEAR